MRTLNLRFLAILVAGLALLGGGTHLLHGYQVRRNAVALLERAHRAEAEGRGEEAEKALSWYLSLRPGDGRTWAWYAGVVDRQDAARRRVERNYLIAQQALRHEPGDRELKRRAADLAMELGRHGDAAGLLAELLETAAEGATAAERAELEDQLGRCEQATGRHADAEKWLVKAVEHDPQRVDAYDRLAWLRRTELRRDEAAGATIREMMARNPRSGRAYAYRWRYARELAPPADEKDVARALELAPDDREVLLAAAMAAEQKKDAAAMRAHLEKGHRLDPKDLTFAMGLARLERREGHSDRAEAVLRRTFEARPVIPVAFELADLLILRDRFEGESGADEMLALLHRAGLGDTLVRFLEAESLVQRKQWSEAIKELETARAVLGSSPELLLRVNLMLAECHGRLGSDEQRLEALRRAADSNRGGEVARMEMVRTLARSGRLDQAIATLSPMAIGGTNPEWRLDLVRLLLQKTARQPRDRRNWPEVEAQLAEAERAMPATADREPVLLLRLEILAAQDKPEEARALLARAIAKEPRKLGYRLAMARLVQPLPRGDEEALRLIEEAEKDIGPNPRITLARLDYWGRRGGAEARAAVAKLAAGRGQVPPDARPAFLDRLGSVAIRLGRPDLARQYWGELAALQPGNVAVRLGLLDLAVQTGDRDEPARLIEQLRRIEGEDGTNWRFARAAWLLDQARRGSSPALDEARRLVAELAERDPNSWVVLTLKGEIAELAGAANQAIAHYLRALELGNVQPSFARRLVTLLDQGGRRDEVARVTQVLRDQGAALAEVTAVQVLDAIRRRDYDLGVSLARQLYPEGSPHAADHLNLGRIYQAAGRSNEAGREYRRAVELGPGVPENWLALVEFLAKARQIDQARGVIEAARRALPPDAAALTLARCALAIGDAKGAEALIGRAMEAPGRADDLAALRVAVDVNLRLNRPEAARPYLDRIAESSSATADDRAWANRTRAALLLATGRAADRDAALSLVDRNLADGPENVEDLAMKASILALTPARRAEAVDILERLAAAGRLDDEHRYLLAQLHLRRGEASKYEDEMRGLLDRKEKDPRHLAQFVNHWIDRGQLDQADRWLAELKQADPRGRPALESEARLLDAKEQRPELLALLETRGRDVPDEIGVVADLLNRYGFFKEAEAAYRTFVAREPGKPERTLALARFLARRGRLPEAMDLFRQTWSTCPPEQVAYAVLGVADLPGITKAQKDQIEAWLVEASRKRPDLTVLSNQLAVSWIRQGRAADAEALLRRVLGSRPDDPDALNALAWVLALRDGGDTREALGRIDRAIETRGRSASLLDTRAVVLIRSGRPEQAVDVLNEARKLDERRSSVALHLAWAYHAQGKSSEAVREFRRAVELGWKAAGSDPLELRFIEPLRTGPGRS